MNIFCVFLFVFSCFLKPCFSEDSKKELLIVGCGGSGTHYTANCLSRGGLDVGHESIASYGYVGWPFTVGFYNYHGDRVERAEFAHVFHQVRDPIKVINTWMKRPDGLKSDYWSFIRGMIPQIQEEDDLITQCAKYWYYWNLKAEEISEWRFRVEDFMNVIDEFESRLGVVLERECIPFVETTMASWGDPIFPQVTWKSLQEQISRDLYRKVRAMAIRYGYKARLVNPIRTENN